jgi:O-6-methylguanine DNA methyltransferase
MTSREKLPERTRVRARAPRRAAPAERFALATAQLLRGETPAHDLLDDELRGLLALARRLRDEGPAPDPAFAEGLRAELLARLRMDDRPAPLLYATISTTLGTLAIAYRNGRAVYCERLEDAGGEEAFARNVARVVGAVPRREPALPPALARAVRDHLLGRRRFTLLDLNWLPPFQQRVLLKTAEIPRGEVRPYAWVAKEIGAPGAVRAVGTALGHNPLPFLIPCHRVVRADGTLGEYSGGGPTMKERVLACEGAPVELLKRGLPRAERLIGCKTTHIVCYPWCRGGRAIRPQNAVRFTSIAEATTAGYRPCNWCRPV